VSPEESEASRHGVGERTFLIVGVNQKTAPDLLRERLQGDDADTFRLLMRCREVGLDQALAVVTCDRCEIWCSVTASEADAVARRIAALLAEAADLEISDIVPRLHQERDQVALRYACAVAASLESTVIGEPQVLGQVKAAHVLASKAEMTGPDLDQVLETAIQAAKRVRHETSIAAQSVSMAACVVSVVRQMHGDLQAISGLLIGDGDMGELMVEHLRGAGVQRWTVLNSNDRQGRAWADRQKAHWRPYGELPAALAAADLVITAQDSARVLIDPTLVRAALKARRRRPMLFIDAAVPGDIDPAINDLYDTFLYTLDDLEHLAMSGRQQRHDATEDAWQIIDQMVAGFEAQQQARSAVPLITDLRNAFELQRRDILANANGADSEEITRRLVNRLLHQPSITLKQLAGDPAAEQLLRRLFDMNKNEE
jgi:glutamyl-tRNA reductase